MLGSFAFLLGSVAFLFDGLWRAGVYAFIIGSSAMVLAELRPSTPKRPSRRDLYPRYVDENDT